jgi:hypothetical protein
MACHRGWLFGLSDVTLTVSVEDDGGDENDDDDGGENDNDNDDNGGCDCEQNGGDCTCDEGAATCNCGAAGCDRSDGLRILSDSVHYLVLGQPFVLDLEADGGITPYAWSAKNGTLPDGLTLSEEGAIEGVLSLVPFLPNQKNQKTYLSRFAMACKFCVE